MFGSGICSSASSGSALFSNIVSEILNSPFAVMK